MIEVVQITKRTVIAPQRGSGFTLLEGQRLRVTDLEGAQVADLFCFSRHDPDDALSSGRSIDYNDSFLFGAGDVLYGQRGLPMLRILEDSCGRHDFLVTPCSAQMFRMLGSNVYHPSCLENLERAFRNFPVNPAQIGTTFNVFMNVAFTGDGRIKVETPLSRAGDSILLEAQMDLIVALTACADEHTNGGRCKPVAYEIY